MLVAKVELWPHGSESNKRTMTTLVIANDTTGNSEYGNYDVWDTAGAHPSDREARVHVGRIERFPRGRDQEHVVDLVTEALRFALPVCWSAA